MIIVQILSKIVKSHDGDNHEMMFLQKNHQNIRSNDIQGHHTPTRDICNFFDSFVFFREK